MNKTLFIDSEETLYDNLYDDSRKQNDRFAANTPLFSASRTAEHISKRLEDASKRISHLETSVSKKKNNNRHPQQTSTIKNKSKNRICRIHECSQCGKTISQEHLDKDLMEKIHRLTADIKKKTKIAQDIEDKHAQLQTEMIRKQEKFLQEEKKYIIEINRLRSLLQTMEHKEWKIQCARNQLQDQLNECQNKMAQLEDRLMACGEQKLAWKRRQSALSDLKRKYTQALQKKELNMQSVHQANNEGVSLLKQFIKNLRNIENIGENTFFDEHRRNHKIYQSVRAAENSQQQELWSKNPRMRNTVQLLGPSVPKMTQSYCIEDGDQGAIIIPPLSLKPQSQPSLEVYRMLLAQASTIEKLIS